MTATTVSRRTAPRRAMIAAGLVMVAAVLTGCLNSNQQDVQDRVNHSRTIRKLTKLPNHANSQKKAQAWAEKLARENKLYHSNLRDGMGTSGWCSIGENVGKGPDVRSIHSAYMASPGHYANIVKPSWNGVGVGYAKATDGTVYTVHVFVQTC